MSDFTRYVLVHKKATYASSLGGNLFVAPAGRAPRAQWKKKGRKF